ncbi:MAG: helix-turn-helix domain-containing protein [Janthinobacterium lividum]
MWAVVVRGSIVTRVDDGVVSLPGNMHVAHMARVGGFQMTLDFQSVSIRMSRRALHLSSAQVDEIMRANFPARQGVPFLIGALATQIVRMEGDLGPASSGALAQSLLDLTAGFADDFFERRSPPEVVRANLVAAARQHIRQHSSSPATNPTSVAAALQVSVRTLQKAFESEHATVAGAILDSRLAEARALLEREAATGVSIDRVCVRSGFASPSSFSRAYKARYGHSPREWRRLHGIVQLAHLT